MVRKFHFAKKKKKLITQVSPVTEVPVQFKNREDDSILTKIYNSSAQARLSPPVFNSFHSSYAEDHKTESPESQGELIRKYRELKQRFLQRQEGYQRRIRELFQVMDSLEKKRECVDKETQTDRYDLEDKLDEICGDIQEIKLALSIA